MQIISGWDYNFPIVVNVEDNLYDNLEYLVLILI